MDDEDPNDREVVERDLLAMWQFDSFGRVSAPVLAEYARYLREYGRAVGPLTAASTFTLRRFMIDRTGRWSPGTLQIVRRAFRSFFSWAHSQGVVADNPAAAIPAVRAPETPVRTAGVDVRDALLAVARCPRDAALVALLFGTGCRRGEAMALSVGDVDLERRSILVRRSKNGTVRRVPMDSVAVDAMTRWLAEREVTGPAYQALWLKADGTPLSQAGGKILLRRLADRAGVVWSPHDARRGLAVRWLAAGGSESGLMAVAGWSDSLLVRRYVRGRAEELAHEEHRRLFG